MLSNVFDLISFIGAVQGVLLAIFLFTRNERHWATFYLASYVLLFSLGLVEPFAVRNLTGMLRTPVLSFLGSSNFLYGPLLYLFVVNLRGERASISKREFLHFVPFTIVLTAELYFNASGSNESIHELLIFFAFEALIVQILIYNVVAIRILRRPDSPSDGGKSSGRNWLRTLLIFITCIYVLSFIISHLIILGWKSAEDFYLAVQISITLLIYIMTYRLILQPRLFLVQSSRLGDQNGNGSGKYVRSGLKEEQADEYLQVLHHYMDKEKPYLNPDLSIYALSQKLNISRNHLTQIINEKLNKNFYEFINEYRVREVKKMIGDTKYAHLNLTGIGLEAGFKSRTAFNINFKKIAGCTPTEWKKAREPDPKNA